MKHKRLICISCILFLGGALIYFGRNRKDVSDLVLENVEALASQENSVIIECYGIGSTYCPKDVDRVSYVHYYN